MTNRRCLSLMAGIALILVLFSCASRGVLEGGKKDENPPRILKENPTNNSINFNKNKLNIYFNEFVTLDGVAEKFIISPPQKKKPRVRERGKRILIQFVDTLKPNTTYSLDFGGSITDFTEGNPLKDYRYSFSTGNHIDTMRMGGHVYDSYSKKPVENAFVMLYNKNAADSVPMKKLPLYLARTDSTGYFAITNIKNGEYKAIALKDLDKNYMFSSSKEAIAFNDSIYKTIAFPVVVNDTIFKKDTTKIDTIIKRNATAFGPEDINLFLFTEKETNQYLVDASRTDRYSLNFRFAIERKGSFKCKFLSVDKDESVFLKERSITNDTLKYWIKDPEVYNLDSLKIELSYWRTDSLGRLAKFKDTVDFDYEDEEILLKHKKPKKGKKAPINYLKVKYNFASMIDPDSKLNILFEEPIKENLDSLIKVQRVVNDSVFVNEKLTILRDSLNVRKYYLDFPFKAGERYKLCADSASIHSLYGRFINKIKKEFSVDKNETYATCDVSIKNAAYPAILNLYTKNGKDIKIHKTLFINKDGKYTFKYIKPGTYFLMMIHDKNNNGIWDTGKYIDRIQPENVFYLDKEIKVRENWEYSEEWLF